MQRVRRRVLYGLTILAWVGVAHFAHMSIVWAEDVTHRVWLMILLVGAGVFTTASLFAFYMAPLERAYHEGFKAGQRASGCSAFRPILTSVDGQRAVGGTVSRIRSTHTDN